MLEDRNKNHENPLLRGLETYINQNNKQIMPPTQPVVEQTWFKDKEITLDGWTFNSCRFDNCKLYVNSANFAINKCFISNDCTIHYIGDILKVIQLFNMSNDSLRSVYPIFAATKHADGTITIGA